MHAMMRSIPRLRLAEAAEALIAARGNYHDTARGFRIWSSMNVAAQLGFLACLG
jgi:hypothetical protein